MKSSPAQIAARRICLESTFAGDAPKRAAALRSLEYAEAIAEMPADQLTPETEAGAQTVREGCARMNAELLSLGRSVVQFAEAAPGVDVISALVARANETQALLLPLAIRTALDADEETFASP